MFFLIESPPLCEDLLETNLLVRSSTESLVIIDSAHMVEDAVVRPLLYPRFTLCTWVSDFHQYRSIAMEGDAVNVLRRLSVRRTSRFPFNVSKGGRARR